MDAKLKDDLYTLLGLVVVLVLLAPLLMWAAPIYAVWYLLTRGGIDQHPRR